MARASSAPSSGPVELAVAKVHLHEPRGVGHRPDQPAVGLTIQQEPVERQPSTRPGRSPTGEAGIASGSVSGDSRWPRRFHLGEYAIP